MIKQRTLKNKISLEGIGLHSGARGIVEIIPAPPDTGIVFQRTDIPGSPDIKADVNSIIHGDLFRRSTIGIKDIKINTIEHFMATCIAFEVDNIFVKINCEEFPFFDGSAKEIAFSFIKAGTEEQEALKKIFIPEQPVGFKFNEIEISVIPSETLKISMLVEYKNKHVGIQNFSKEITREVFINEIAPARTFGFVEEIEPLRKAGLIKGGSLDNALIFGDEGLINKTELRFPDEIVRHKVLDLIGDLALIGKLYKGHYIAIKSGHKTHLDFVKKLLNNKGE